MSVPPLSPLLARSKQLHAGLWAALPDPYQLAEETPRAKVSLVAALMAEEQARACRLLISEGMHTTAIAVNRVQFEALCRSLWTLYAASDEEVEVLAGDLTPESERLANKLPMAADMVKKLESSSAPDGVHALMAGYKDAMLKQLHSFLHAGIHPLKRHTAGYPEQLLRQIVANANGLLVATGATLAILAGSPESMRRMNEIQREFADCTPELLER
jgi:hypothetical protein